MVMMHGTRKEKEKKKEKIMNQARLSSVFIGHARKDIFNSESCMNSTVE